MDTLRFLENLNPVYKRSARVLRPDTSEAVAGSPASNAPVTPAKSDGGFSPDGRAADLLLIQQMRAALFELMPNIGRCSAPDLPLLNRVLAKSREVLSEAGMIVPGPHR